MNEPVPCPSCGVLLRLPDGAARIRCPGCQSILELDIDEPVPTAIPLPFGPPKAKPKPAQPANVVEPVRGKPAAKARAVPDDEPNSPYAPPKPGDDVVDEEAREADIRRQLAEVEAKERKASVVFDTLAEQCKNARLGLQILAIAATGSSLVALMAVLFLVTSLTGAPMPILLGMAFLLLAGHSLLCLVGFGFCIAGPKGMRGKAVVGIVAVLAHSTFNAVAAVAAAASVGIRSLQERDNVESFLGANLILSNAVCNLTVVADVPYYFQQSNPPPIGIVLLLAFAAGLEFAKLSVVGLLTNQYANAAKDPDLAFAGMRFVYRIFAILLIAPLIKGIIGGTVVPSLMWIPMLLGTVAYYLWWAFAWFAQYQTMMDTAEIVTAGRMTDKRRRIDVV